MLVAVAGCSAPLPTTQLPPTRLVAPALEFPELRDYRGIVDCPIKAAGLDESAIADLARNAQIDFVTIADPAVSGVSDYGIGGFTNQILFIPGAAFRVDGGEIVGVNLRQPIDASRPAAELIGAIHDQGALAIAADPGAFKSAADYALADAMEVYNQNDSFMAASPTTLYWRAMFLQTDHFLLGLAPRPDANLALYDTMTAGARVTLVAGMGAPDNLSVMGSKVGTFEQLFLFYTTHLLARERDVDALMDAMHRGHAYVSFDILGYVGEFAFFAQTGDSQDDDGRRGASGNRSHAKSRASGQRQPNRDAQRRNAGSIRRRRDGPRVRAQSGGSISSRSMAPRPSVDYIESGLRPLIRGGAARTDDSQSDTQKLIPISILGALIAMCTGCGSAAKQNPASQTATLQDGATTYAQVIAGMGEPYQDYGDQDGSRTVVYMLNPEPAAANTHSPQAASQVQNKLTLKFDPNGILASHSTQPASAAPSPQ